MRAIDDMYVPWRVYDVKVKISTDAQQKGEQTLQKSSSHTFFLLSRNSAKLFFHKKKKSKDR